MKVPNNSESHVGLGNPKILVLRLFQHKFSTWCKSYMHAIVTTKRKSKKESYHAKCLDLLHDMHISNLINAKAASFPSIIS